MDLMAVRRSLMNVKLESHGWGIKSFVADRTVADGGKTTALIREQLPDDYKYAVVLRNDISNIENNAYIGGVFIPSRNAPFILRYRNGSYGFLMEPTGQHDVKISQGDELTVYWKTDKLNTKTIPTTGWQYEPLFLGTVTNCGVVRQRLESVNNDNWNVMISVADLDFNTFPSTNRAYCFGFNTSNFAGNWIRTNGGAYQQNTSWTTSFECKIDENTAIACFYL